MVAWLRAIASATPKNTAGRSRIGLARRDLDCRGSGTCADHRLEIRTATVLRAVSVIDTIVDWPVDRLEGDLLRHAGGDHPPCPLPYGGLIPARLLSVVAADVEGVIDRDRPNPRRGAVRHPVLTERRDVQIVCFSDLAQLVHRPQGHLFVLLDYGRSSVLIARRSSIAR